MSVTVSSTLTPTTMAAALENVAAISPTTEDIVVGISMVIVSILCIIPNIIVVKAISSDKELLRLNAYKFMLFLAYIDIVQLFPHTVTGFFNIFQTTFNDLFAKLLGAIATPSYVAYAVLTLILSLNRLTQLCFPRIDEKIFSKRGTQIWIASGIFFFIAFSAALASPFGTIRYYPEAWAWGYDYEYAAGSKTIQNIEMVIELGGIPISGIIYLIVFGVLIAKRKKYQVSKNYRAEMKILIQAGVITGYCSVLNVFWHFSQYLLPATNCANMAINFMWIFNCAVNPIVYIIVNAAIRKNTKIRSRSVAGIIVITQYQRNKTKSTPYDDPATVFPLPKKSQKVTQAPLSECPNKKIVFLT